MSSFCNIAGSVQSSGEISAAMSMQVEGSCVPAIYTDESIDASLRWLQSAPLTDEGKAAITRGVVDGAHKLTAFQFMMAVRRARRLAKSQQWLDDIQDQLMSEQILASQQSNPFFLLSVGRFIRDVQQDDTAFLQSMAKAESDTLVAAKQAVEKREVEPDDELAKKIQAIPPHKREQLRKMMEALRQEDKP